MAKCSAFACICRFESLSTADADATHDQLYTNKVMGSCAVLYATAKPVYILLSYVRSAVGQHC
eukprot:17537-Heterococcus_DN1.PRE.3